MNDKFHHLIDRDQSDYLSAATHFVSKLVPNASFRVADDHYIGDNGVAHVRFRQTIHGVDIRNADFNVNVGTNGKIFSYGQSFHTVDLSSTKRLFERCSYDPVAAFQAIVEGLHLPISLTEIHKEEGSARGSHVLKGVSAARSFPNATLAYIFDPDRRLIPVWEIEIDLGYSWILAYVDVDPSKKIHGVVDYVSNSHFEVYKMNLNNPSEGPRTVQIDPWDKTASPFTWNGDGDQNYSTTRGNNAIAQSNPSGDHAYLDNFRPYSKDCNFEYPYDLSMSPPESYINASVVQLFYTVNAYHDLLYALGFKEKAGNFQWNNNGNGGRDHDYVIVNTQDGGGINGADFATPPDGQPARMRMTVWDESSPFRDGSFDAGIVIHEYTHGLSNRLTGGPANSGCLSAWEAKSMGEGWSDFMATAIRSKSHDTRATDYAYCEWASNQQAGIRPYLYSTSLATNPLTYASIDKLQTEHQAGTVWATMLYEVLWNLIDKHGMGDSPKPKFVDKVPTDGKYLAMKLVMDGMALQPCNPNFVQARDAILDADTALTSGANHCDLWKGFAKRGLGSGAKYNPSRRTDNKDVPPNVC